MSVNNILIDGKVNPAFLPNGGGLPANGVFQSLGIEAIASSGGGSGDAVINLQNYQGDDAYIIKGGNGSLIVLQETNEVFTVSANGYALGIGNTVVQQANITSSGSVLVEAPIVNLGDYTEPDPIINVIGDGATGRVYDDYFNPVNKAPEEAGSGVISITGGSNLVIYPPALTGLYNFTLTLSLDVGAVIGTGCIVIVATTGATGPAIPQLCHTIVPATLVDSAGSGGASTPIRYAYSFMAYLTKDVDVYYSIIPVGSGWANIDFQLFVGQMC